MGNVVVDLPGGILDDAGQRQRTAVVRPLTGHEEELLASGSAGPAHLVTTVLARCVERIGTREVTEQVARDLGVGDRQALLLALRQATFGPTVTAVVTCPWRDCSERMDIDFAIPDIPVRAAADLPALHEITLSAAALGVPGEVDGGGSARPGQRVAFRLPTGADQEAIGTLAADDPIRALDALLERCVLPSADETACGIRDFTPRARAEIEQAMLAASFGPELSLGASCPECGRSFTLPFDIQDFFFGEVAITPDLLLREVHYLAFHYHWSEEEILALPRDRRHRYLQVIEDEISGRADALV